jgi:uncharacterized protein YegP (UPF0339 family)
MFQILRGNGGGYFWRLKSENHETLCHSEIYTTKQAALDGIAAAKRIASNAPIQDLT